MGGCMSEQSGLPTQLTPQSREGAPHPLDGPVKLGRRADGSRVFRLHHSDDGLKLQTLNAKHAPKDIGVEQDTHIVALPSNKLVIGLGQVIAKGNLRSVEVLGPNMDKIGSITYTGTEYQYYDNSGLLHLRLLHSQHYTQISVLNPRNECVATGSQHGLFIIMIEVNVAENQPAVPVIALIRAMLMHYRKEF